MKIFISYARKDQSFVENLQNLLVESGYEAWFDKDLIGGEDWWKGILKSIRACDVFVFILSPESTNSDACRVEFEFATKLNKPILPLMLRSAELPNGKLRETQFIETPNLSDIKIYTKITRALNNFMKRIANNEFPFPDPMPDDLPFPFPPDPLTEIRTISKNINHLPEEEIFSLIYKIKRIAQSNEHSINEIQDILSKIASNHQLPYDVVKIAQNTLSEVIPKHQKANNGKWFFIIPVIIALIGIIAIYITNNLDSKSYDPTTQWAGEDGAEQLLRHLESPAATSFSMYKADTITKYCNC